MDCGRREGRVHCLAEIMVETRTAGRLMKVTGAPLPEAPDTQSAAVYLLTELRKWEKPYNATDPTGLAWDVASDNEGHHYVDLKGNGHISDNSGRDRDADTHYREKEHVEHYAEQIDEAKAAHDPVALVSAIGKLAAASGEYAAKKVLEGIGDGLEGVGSDLGVSIVEGNKLDIRGNANTVNVLVDSDGGVTQVRIYGPDGNAFIDIDNTDHGNPSTHPIVPHVHFWDWSTGKPMR